MYIKEGMNKEAVRSYLDASDQHVAKESYQDARQMFEKVLALDPANKAVYHKAGVVYFKEGKFDEARKSLKRAVENDPENQDLINLYLEALTKTGRDNDAEDVYRSCCPLILAVRSPREALSDLPHQEDYDKALTEAAALAGHRAENMDFSGAAEILKELIAVSSDPVAGAAALADIFTKHQRATDGARELVQAADALIVRNSPDDAREVLGRAALLAPDSTRSRKSSTDCGPFRAEKGRCARTRAVCRGGACRSGRGTGNSRSAGPCAAEPGGCGRG